MKRKGFIVLSLLLVASFMAALGSGAIDIFSAERASAMKIVNDSKALIAITGDNAYAKENSDGVISIDFTNTNSGFTAEGVNPKAKNRFNKVFRVTNQSPKKVYVWLESKDWESWLNHQLRYLVNVDSITGFMIGDRTSNTAPKNILLWTSGNNFKDGKGYLAYVELDPGEYFDVDISIDTSGYYGVANKYYSDWSHTVTVKAAATAPEQLR